VTVAAGHQPNPYVGPRPFRPGEPLYGRDREARQLADLLIAKRIVVLHSPSGAGKTSLIQAALIPALREEGFTVLPIVRVNRAPPATGVGGNGARPNRFLLSALLSLHDEAAPAAAESALGPAPSLADGVEADLVRYLDRRPRANESPHDVLVVDQFEEILTADPTDQAGIRAFFAEVGRALEDRGRWALFAIREDYLAALEPYVRPIPTRLKTTFRLDLLDPAAARAAIQRPARAVGVDFNDAAAEKLIDDLRQQVVQRPDGTVDAVLGQWVEPMQLQVVCRRLWEQLPSGDRAIGPEQVLALGEVDAVLGDFYAREIEQVVAATGIGEHRLRAWVGDHLLTRQGVRGQALWEPGRGAELNEAIWRLVDGHLVRAEQRRGATWFELAHDRLVEPVRRSNEEWFQANLSALQRGARLWDDEARDPGYLLTGDALDEAELWAATHADLLTPVERDFLDACRALKQARAGRRLRTRLAAMAAFALAAIVIAVVTWVLKSDAEAQAQNARVARATAQAERDQAEVAELVARAASLGNEQLDRALLLSVAAEQRSPSVETRNTLLREVFDHPNLIRYFWRHATDKANPSVNANVNGVDFSHDGSIIASADATGRIWLWDPATGIPLDIQLNQSEKQTGINGGALKFSPDGKMLAAGSWRDLVIWNVKTGVPHLKFAIGDETKINALAFNRDGAVLASGDEHGSIRLWDPTTGDPIAPPLNQSGGSTPDSPIRALAYNSSGILASGGDDGGVALWDPTTGRLRPQQLRPTAKCPTGLADLDIGAVAFSEKDFNLLAVGADATVTLWDVTSGDCLFPPMRGHSGPVTDLAFSPDGRIVASSSLDGSVVLWDVETGRDDARLTRPGHTGGVTSVAFGPDSKTLATGSRDESVIVWNVTDQPLWTVLDQHRNEVTSVAFSPDRRTLASGSKDGTVILWDLATHGPSPQLEVSEGWVTSVAFSPDGRTLAVGACKGLRMQGEPCEGGEITLWNVADRTKRAPTLSGFLVGVDSVAFSRDGEYLAAGGCEVKDMDEDSLTPRPHCTRAKTLLWTLDAVYAGHNEPAKTLDDGWESVVNSILFSRDGKWLAVGGRHAPPDATQPDRGSLRLWAVGGDTTATQALGDPTLLQKTVLDLALSPDGKTLASSDENGSVFLWDLATREQLGTPLTDHTAGALITSVAFDPTGEFFASGSRDRTSREKPVVIRDASSLAEFVVFPSLHTGWINDIAFSEDGQTLASASQDGTVILWELDPAVWRERACDRAGRNLREAERKEYLDGAGADLCPNQPSFWSASAGSSTAASPVPAE
jgi:WD40 repeat protein